MKIGGQDAVDLNLISAQDYADFLDSFEYKRKMLIKEQELAYYAMIKAKYNL